MISAGLKAASVSDFTEYQFASLPDSDEQEIPCQLDERSTHESPGLFGLRYI